MAIAERVFQNESYLVQGRFRSYHPLKSAQPEHRNKLFSGYVYVRFGIVAIEKVYIHHDDDGNSSDEAPKKCTTKHDIDKPEPEDAE